jgi:hypothetical protein
MTRPYALLDRTGLSRGRSASGLHVCDRQTLSTHPDFAGCTGRRASGYCLVRRCAAVTRRRPQKKAHSDACSGVGVDW